MTKSSIVRSAALLLNRSVAKRWNWSSSSCVTALAECGIPRDNIRLLGVTTEVESGLVLKSSSAIYDLEINCESVDLLGSVLAALSSQKNSKIVAIAWRYTDLLKTKQEVLQEAVRAAKASANAIAESLGTTLLGVHKLSYETKGLDTESRLQEESNDALHVRRRKGRSDEFASMNLAHTTRLLINVRADFIVPASGSDA